MREAIADALEEGRLVAAETKELGAAGARRIREQLIWARGHCTAVSYRAALREWRWLAILRWWRLKAATKVGRLLEPMAAARVDVLGMVATWGETACTRGSHRPPPPVNVWLDRPGVGARAKDGVEARALTPRAKLRWCGGRRLFDKLKGFAVHAGHESDRFGFWAVDAVVDVRRPVKRRGQQLDVLVQFAGCDPLSKAPWPQQWVSITWLKPDLKEIARAMERTASVVTAQAAQTVGPAAAPGGAGVKRPWAGLVWDGADEGRLRRGRSGAVPASVVIPSSAPDSSTAPAAAAAPSPSAGSAPTCRSATPPATCSIVSACATTTACAS